MIKAFTLIELMVVMALISGMMAISIIGLSSLVKVDMKYDISKITGLLNETYSVSVIAGKTHRVVIDFVDNSFFVEEKSGDLENIVPDLGYEEEEEKKFLEEKNMLSSFVKLEGKLGEKTYLKKDLKFLGIWVEGMTQVKREQKGYIYFFPDGYTQLSFISISQKNDDEDSMSIILQPLTGMVSTQVAEPLIDELVNKKNE